MSIVELYLDSGLSLISYHGVVVPYNSDLWKSPEILQEKLAEARQLMPFCDDTARLYTVFYQYDRRREFSYENISNYETSLRRAESNPFLNDEQKELAAEILERLEISQLQHERSRRIPIALKESVFKRDGGNCRYCGVSPDQPHFDHVIPFSRGGKTELSNLVLSCRSCNSRKAAKTPEEAGMSMVAI